jgi:hypothetical protein
MRSRLLSFCLSAATIAVFLAQPAIGYFSSADSNHLVWSEPVPIKRVKRPNRKPPSGRKRPAVVKAPLLTLQWNLLLRGNGNEQIEVDPARVFENDDQVKLAFTTNQDGYLYIINQPEGKDGEVLFPDLRIDGGSNRVQKNRRYVIPSYCPTLSVPDDCWWNIDPPAGREMLLVIFSRDPITTLPDKVSADRAVVERHVIRDIKASSNLKSEKVTGDLEIPGQGVIRYSTRVQNVNPKDNEELIAIIEINHGE